MYDDFKYTASNGLLGAYWGKNYAVIYQCNDILDAIAEKETAGQTEAEDIINKGEASFFRAYCYFNLVRAFGEVPLVTYKINDASEANIPKTTVDKIYEQIDADLKTAEESLPETWSTEYLGRLTWGAARSLHARTYMMRNDWNNMYTASTDVIKKGLYNLRTPYNEIFTDDGENSGGSIFELQCTATAALPQSDIIGSQFCEVQGVRGADQWDLGWGWHMATELMAQAYEPGDPRKNATLLYAFLGHAVDTSQIAAVRHRYSDIIYGSSILVFHIAFLLSSVIFCFKSIPRHKRAPSRLPSSSSCSPGRDTSVLRRSALPHSPSLLLFLRPRRIPCSGSVQTPVPRCFASSHLPQNQWLWWDMRMTSAGIGSPIRTSV